MKSLYMDTDELNERGEIVGRTAFRNLGYNFGGVYHLERFAT